MERLIDLVKPKTYNKVGYCFIILWIIIGAILIGIFTEIEISESSDFRCAAKLEKMDHVRAKCFEQYTNRHSKSSFPVFAFAILNFIVSGFFCVIYSIYVNSKVDRLLDPERQRPPETRRLFGAYFCQLVARFAFGILFAFLRLLYPSNFPSNFDCNLTPETSPVANASGGNNHNTTYECHNQIATQKTFWLDAMSVVNGLFAFIILIEIILILSRAKNGGNFMEDSQFFADHFRIVNRVQPLLQVELPQEPEQEDSQEEGNEIPQEPQLASFLEMMKKSITENTEKPTDLKALFKNNPREGETKDLNIDQIYTKLLLHPNRAEYDFPEDRLEQLKVYPKPKEPVDLDTKNLKPRGPEDIIDAENKKIVIIGRPGIGKTLFCTKFIRDWASGRVFNTTQDAELDFGIAFLIKFRRFNSVETLSLRELLASAEYSQTECLADEIWNYILEHPEKVLILFDGMDELVDHSRIADETENNSYRDSVKQKMPLAALYSKIANGKLLPRAAVVTTTKPTALSSIKVLPYDKEYEILGFASEEVEEYVENFTKNAAENSSGAGEKIWQHISTNMNLFSLCYIPVNCFIICSCLLQVLRFHSEKGSNLIAVGLPTKLTQIYKQAVKLFYFRHNEQYRGKHLSREESDEFPPEFKQLEEVAFNGVKKRKVIFVKSEVQGLENSSLFHLMPDRQIGPFEYEAQFCFMHLTMQEFLAAKHITDTMNEEELRRFVSDNIKKGEWQVVLQFVAGLLGERDDKSIEIFTSLLPVKTEKLSDEMTQWPTDSDKHLALTIIKCLYEGSKLEVIHPLVQNKLDGINCNSVVFSNCGLAPADCTALVHIMKNMKQISLILLPSNHIGSLGCVEIKKMLQSDKSKLTSLNLMNNGIGDEGLVHLSQGIKTSELTELFLSGNKDITREAEERFREDNPNCTVFF